MSMVRVIYNNDKTVRVIHPAPNSKRYGEPNKDWLKRVLDKSTPEGAIYEDIDKSELPTSREFRNAWEGEKGKGITVNQAKADEINDARELEKLIKEEKELLEETNAVNSLIEKGVLNPDGTLK